MNKVNNKLLKDFINNPIDKLIEYNINNKITYFMSEDKEYKFFIFHSYNNETAYNFNHSIINPGHDSYVTNENSVYPVNLYLLMRLFYETKN